MPIRSFLNRNDILLIVIASIILTVVAVFLINRFAFAAATNCYWVGDTSPANWNDASHWSSASGGGGNTCDGGVVPGSDDTVIFDGVNTNDVDVDTSVSIAALTNAGGYSGTLSTQNNSFAVSGDWQWDGGVFSAGSSTVTIGGSYSNLGTFTAGTSTVNFNATTSGKTLSGNLNDTGSSSFYKVAFSGSGGGWTIENAMKVSAANATNTFVIGNGTVTLGDSDGDNLEVMGKMTIAATSGQTGTFQTAALSQGNSIYFDMNDNATRPACSNCYIQVGQSVAESGQGNLKIRKNTVVRLNPNDASSYSSIQVERTGYLEVQGGQDVNNATSTDLDTVALRETKLCANVDFSAGHSGKNIRMNSGLAIGKIYDISASTVNDTDCASDTDDSVTRADNSTDTDASPTVSGTDSNRTLTLSIETIVTVNKEHIGKYVHNLTDDKYYKIVWSNETGVDTLKIIGEPDDLSTMDSNDDIEVTDGIKPGDTFDVLDYADITAESGTACSSTVGLANYEAYIYAKQYSETLIQYANICNMGKGLANTEGIRFTNVNGSNPNEGLTINKSRIRKNYDGVMVSGSSNNGTGEGITNSSISENTNYGLFIASSSNNNDISGNNIYSNSSYSIYLYTASSNNLTSNISYNNGSQAGFYIYLNSNNNTLTSNIAFNDGQGFWVESASHNNNLTSNISFGNNLDGIYVNNSSNVLINSNYVYNNTNYGIELNANSNNNTVTSNTSYKNGSGIGLVGSPYDTLSFNDFFENTSYGMLLVNSTSNSVINSVLMANDSYSNGISATGFNRSLNDVTGTIGINESYGALGTNGTSDIYYSPASSYPHNLRLYNSTLASSTEASAVTYTGSYIISRKNDTTAGLTKVWGEYTVLDQISETPQNETIDKYNYTESLWEDSFSTHSYNAGMGAGTEDTDLDFAISGSFGGDNSVYHYRIFCAAATCGSGDGAVWEVYRNDTLLTNEATKGTLYTDTQNDGGSAPSIQFKIDGGVPTEYTYGATYNFTAWKGATDNNVEKTLYMMQDGDQYNVDTDKEVQFLAEYQHRNTVSHDSGGNSYNINITGGTYSSEFTDYTYLAGSTGLDIQNSSTVGNFNCNSFDYMIGTVGVDDAFVTIDSHVIDSIEKIVIGNNFTNSGSGAEFNVNRSAFDDSGYWDFTGDTGTFGTEDYDGRAGVNEENPGMLRWPTGSSPLTICEGVSESPPGSPPSGSTSDESNIAELPEAGGIWDQLNPFSKDKTLGERIINWAGIIFNLIIIGLIIRLITGRNRNYYPYY